MFRISIDIYTLLGVLSIAFILLVAIILIFIAYMCHDKRKYKSINKFNEQTFEKSKSYNDNLKKYDKNIEKSGVNTNIKSKLKVISLIIKLFKRGSK